MPSSVDAPLVVTSSWSVPPDELGWRFSRASGPGGQGVNTADSRVELVWSPDTSRSLAAQPAVLVDRVRARLGPALVQGSVVVVAAEHRAQLRNREAARARLAQRLREAAAPPPNRRRPTRPTRGSVERRLQDKAARASVKAQRRRPV